MMGGSIMRCIGDRWLHREVKLDGWLNHEVALVMGGSIMR